MCLINNAKGIFFKTSKKTRTSTRKHVYADTDTGVEQPGQAPSLLCLAQGGELQRVPTPQQGQSSHANTSLFFQHRCTLTYSGSDQTVGIS